MSVVAVGPSPYPVRITPVERRLVADACVARARWLRNGAAADAGGRAREKRSQAAVLDSLAVLILDGSHTLVAEGQRVEVVASERFDVV